MTSNDWTQISQYNNFDKFFSQRLPQISAELDMLEHAVCQPKAMSVQQQRSCLTGGAALPYCQELCYTSRAGAQHKIEVPKVIKPCVYTLNPFSSTDKTEACTR